MGLITNCVHGNKNISKQLTMLKKLSPTSHQHLHLCEATIKHQPPSFIFWDCKSLFIIYFSTFRSLSHLNTAMVLRKENMTMGGLVLVLTWLLRLSSSERMGTTSQEFNRPAHSPKLKLCFANRLKDGGGHCQHRFMGGIVLVLTWLLGLSSSERMRTTS